MTEGNVHRHVMALPAYDRCIKASHVFNLLDARGVISVTERQSYILRVRELAKHVARPGSQPRPGPAEGAPAGFCACKRTGRRPMLMAAAAAVARPPSRPATGR